MEDYITYVPEVVLRVRFHIIRNACIENVGKSQSCMVSKVRMIWKQTVAGARGQQARELSQVEEELVSIHSSLFPALSNAYPTGFPVKGFTLKKFLAAAAWVDARTVIDGDNMVVLPLKHPLELRSYAPTVRVEVGQATVQLVATVDLPAETELCLGEHNPGWKAC